MSSEQMSFKARIKRIASEEQIPAQVVLQNFMFERFFARLSKTTIYENLIVKGGTLISQYLGLSKRSTMDIDLTMVGAKLSEETITQYLNMVFTVDLEDDISWDLKSIAPIRHDDMYGGFRVKLIAAYKGIVVPFSIDISTGDAITPAPQDFIFMSRFTPNGNFRIKAYTIETVLAEKIEAILSLGVLSTRPRDYYDAYMILCTVKYGNARLSSALRSTAIHRGTEEVLEGWSAGLRLIEGSSAMRERWEKYCREFSYAKGIPFDEVCEKIRQVLTAIF
ncbi:MAG: nucleotidyl transferase AbiEii/AbiGii toxin family protein [Kiritimatiellae bacterium]|nr:nucleotidyl transferase AbiEii/AbiGii toxin family protein [Kiritimatiellia bacterium]